MTLGPREAFDHVDAVVAGDLDDLAARNTSQSGS